MSKHTLHSESSVFRLFEPSVLVEAAEADEADHWEEVEAVEADEAVEAVEAVEADEAVSCPSHTPHSVELTPLMKVHCLHAHSDAGTGVAPHAAHLSSLGPFCRVHAPQFHAPGAAGGDCIDAEATGLAAEAAGRAGDILLTMSEASIVPRFPHAWHGHSSRSCTLTCMPLMHPAVHSIKKSPTGP